MPALGGFFAVSYISATAFDKGLQAIWAGHWQEMTRELEWQTATPFGILRATGRGAVVTRPLVTLDGASNRVRVQIDTASRYDLELAGSEAGSVFVQLKGSLAVPVVVSQDHVFDKAQVDLSGVLVDSALVGLTWYRGPQAASAEPALLSEPARRQLSEVLRQQLERYLTFTLPTDRVWAAELAMMTKAAESGQVILPPFLKVKGCRIFDGWLALGIDRDGEATAGNLDAIGLPPDAPPPTAAPLAQADPGDGSIRLVIDKNSLLQILQQNAKMALIMASATRPNVHPSQDVTVSLANDAIVIHAHGTVDAPDPLPGTIPFTADITVRPFVGKSQFYVYASIKPNIKAETPWWVDVLAGIYDFFGGDVFAKLRKVNKSEMAPLFSAHFRQVLPDFPHTEGFIEGRQIVVRPDLVGFWGVGGISSWWTPPTEDLTPAVTGFAYVRNRVLPLFFRHERYEHDPSLRVRYTVRRPSDGAVLTSGMVWGGSGEPFDESIDLWDSAHARDNFFEVDLVSERPPGHVIATATHQITLADLFDRAHPYARFRKKHFLPGSRGVPYSTIESAVHRTDMHQRCRYCDVGVKRRSDNYEVEAIDALPPPRREGFSSRLCPYCFPST